MDGVVLPLDGEAVPVLAARLIVASRYVTM